MTAGLLLPPEEWGSYLTADDYPDDPDDWTSEADEEPCFDPID